MTTTATTLPAVLIDDLLEGVCAATDTLETECDVYRRLARLALGKLPAQDAQALLGRDMDFMETDTDPDARVFSESEAAAEAYLAIRDFGVSSTASQA